MPDPRDATTVAPQITDAVTQANVMVLGSAPAVAVGMLYQTTMQALMLAMNDAVFAHQQLAITGQAATVRGIEAMLDPAALPSTPEER